VSSIPVPSSSSPPAAVAAAVAVANRASQEPALCSCRARAACKQPNRGSKRRREGEGAKRVTDDKESKRKMRQRDERGDEKSRKGGKCKGNGDPNYTFIHLILLLL